MGFWTRKRSGRTLEIPAWFETARLQKVEHTDQHVLWRNAVGQKFLMSFIPSGEELPPVGSSEALIGFGREIAESRDGGLISIETVEPGGMKGAQLIYKRPEGLGYSYTGMLFVLTTGGTLVLSSSFGEGNMTGVREARITATLFEEGRLDIDTLESGVEGKPIPGWFEDPYDPVYDGPALRSLSDDETYDAEFPDHPLSALRRMLEELRNRVKPTG